MRTVLAASLALVLLGCPPDPVDPGGDGGADERDPSWPCEVRDVVQRRCAHCHSEPPTSGAPTPLLSGAAFRAHSGRPDDSTVGERSVLRMTDPAAPMPPASEPPLTSEELATVEAWVADGMPSGACAALPGRPAPRTCASEQFWAATGTEDARMAPGQACRQCHLQQASDRAYFFMGTIFPAFHEADDCQALPPSGAVVEILDSMGTVRLTLTPNDVGNFLSSSVAAPFPVPYTARVRANGRQRSMTTAQTNGDCNACHTEQGSQGAPGRIVWP